MQAGATAMMMARQNATTGGPPVMPDFLWIDASDATSVTSSAGRISQINDLSGNGHHLTAAGGFRPFTGRTLNGLGVLDFQSDQYLARTAAIGFDTTDYTVIGVWGTDADQQYAGFVVVHNGGATNDYDSANGFVLTSGVAGTQQFVVFHGASSGTPAGTGGGATTIGRWAIRKNAGASQTGLYRTTGVESTATFVSSGTANGGIVLGARFVGGAISVGGTDDGLNGLIAEVLIYTPRLSDANMTSLYSYLGTKWGV
jgi:hypothetical protein